MEIKEKKTDLETFNQFLEDLKMTSREEAYKLTYECDKIIEIIRKIKKEHYQHNEGTTQDIEAVSGRLVEYCEILRDNASYWANPKTKKVHQNQFYTYKRDIESYINQFIDIVTRAGHLK
jgi:hypothetical protein